MISFYFFNFFVNRLYSFLPSSLLNARLHFHVIHPHLIIQHKVSFSSRFISFLGGLSLHLNHLIASCTTNYDWPIGTLPFGLFWPNLDTRDLETYPRTHSGHF